MSAAPHFDPEVERILGGLVRRQRAVRLVGGLLRGTFYGVATGAVVAIVGLLLGGNVGVWPLLAGAVAGVVAGVIIALAMPIDRLQLARRLDRACSAKDRFASAVQFHAHPKRERARLVCADALRAVVTTAPAAAIPLRWPREAKWLPAPLLALVLAMWLIPDGPVAAAEAVPEVTPEQWQDLSHFLRNALADLPEPMTEEEGDLDKRLEELAKLLEREPDKKEALAELARLKEDLERQRKQARQPDMQRAAKAISSKALQEFAKSLEAGDYKAAAQNLDELAQRLRDQVQKMSAEDFDSMGADMEALAQQMQENAELSEAAAEAAEAAARMNREQLAEALKRFAEQVRRNAERLRQADRLGRAGNSLEELQRRLGRMGLGQRPGPGLVRGPGASKGGLRAGWGSMEEWGGGKLAEGGESLPELSDPKEGPGEISMLSSVSPNEEATSAQPLRERYIDLVRMAEADVDLEEVPVAYRDYLRQYFVSIRAGLEAEAAEEESGE